MSKLLAANGCDRSLELFGQTLAGGGPFSPPSSNGPFAQCYPEEVGRSMSSGWWNYRWFTTKGPCFKTHFECEVRLLLFVQHVKQTAKSSDLDDAFRSSNLIQRKVFAIYAAESSSDSIVTRFCLNFHIKSSQIAKAWFSFRVGFHFRNWPTGHICCVGTLGFPKHLGRKTWSEKYHLYFIGRYWSKDAKNHESPQPLPFWLSHHLEYVFFFTKKLGPRFSWFVLPGRHEWTSHRWKLGDRAKVMIPEREHSPG